MNEALVFKPVSDKDYSVTVMIMPLIPPIRSLATLCGVLVCNYYFDHLHQQSPLSTTCADAPSTDDSVTVASYENSSRMRMLRLLSQADTCPVYTTVYP